VAARIEYEVLNGISAGLAAPTSIGIPLTHRDLCHGVAFVTGHTQADGSLPWQPLLAAGVTLVVYMGVANLPSIVAELRACGTRASMPIAVIQDATLPSQRELICTLDTVVEQVATHHMASPSVIIIGEVVTLNRATAIADFTRDSVAAPLAAHA
jgi:uroporphyrin-III C-methyltransferase